jgi:hypothetical protein
MARVILDITTRIVVDTEDPQQDWVYWVENFVEMSAEAGDDVSDNKITEDGEIMGVTLVEVER